MLAVRFKSRVTREATWHIGEKTEEIREAAISDGLLLVQADGDELDYIHRIFPSIRDCTRPVVTWFGDDARFIAANL